jgi:hypothetical protein
MIAMIKNTFTITKEKNMQFAITVLLFAMVLSGCAQAPPAQADKQQASPAQAEKQNLSPEQQRFKQAFSKMIKDGHVNDVCQDMKGVWVEVERAEGFRVCRLEQGFMSAGPGYVQVLHTWKNSATGGGLLMPLVVDCAGRRWHRDQDVSYDSAGRITDRRSVALGGEWTSIQPGSEGDAVVETVCKGAIN